MNQYVLTIYFNVDSNYIVDERGLGDVIADRMENYDSAIQVVDTDIEEVNDSTPPNIAEHLPNLRTLRVRSLVVDSISKRLNEHNL
jgi:hypothetical protein